MNLSPLGLIVFVGVIVIGIVEVSKDLTESNATKNRDIVESMKGCLASNLSKNPHRIDIEPIYQFCWGQAGK